MRAQLQHVAQVLKSAAIPGTPPSPQAAELKETTPKLSELKNTRKALEDALAGVPDIPEMAQVREDIKSKIEEKTAAIRGAAPMGAQLDGARAALARSRTRKEEAVLAMELAKAAVEAAEEEEETLAKRVEELQACVVQNPVPSPLEEVTRSLQACMDALATSGHTTPEHLAQAKEYSERLITGFQGCFAFSQQATDAAKPPPPQMRTTAKSPAPAPAPAARGTTEPHKVRHVGKQAPKRVITDYFAAKPSKVFRAATEMIVED